jgi:hypothetical protein
LQSGAPDSERRDFAELGDISGEKSGERREPNGAGSVGTALGTNRARSEQRSVEKRLVGKIGRDESLLG